MKNISTIISSVCLVLICVLFYLFYNHTEQIKVISEKTDKQTASTFRIAYFELDSLEAHYNYFKDALNQLKEKETSMNNKLAKISQENQGKILEWQKRGASMTQAESQQVQQEYAQMQQEFLNEKQKMQDELAKNNSDIMTDIKSKIEGFLKEYNRQKNFSFIFSYDPTTFIYYKDSAFNITTDVISGLNAGYKKK
ncbi:MAG TPA: OmpH family outer membrane protein [Puia sp.]|nr:OmpH family outer membrane protein [Puia sp.]